MRSCISESFPFNLPHVQGGFLCWFRYLVFPGPFGNDCVWGEGRQKYLDERRNYEGTQCFRIPRFELCVAYYLNLLRNEGSKYYLFLERVTPRHTMELTKHHDLHNDLPTSFTRPHSVSTLAGFSCTRIYADSGKKRRSHVQTWRLRSSRSTTWFACIANGAGTPFVN